MRANRRPVMPFLALLALLLCLPLQAQARTPTELTWYGHAAFRIKTPGGKVLLIDPWIGNPSNKPRRIWRPSSRWI